MAERLIIFALLTFVLIGSPGCSGNDEEPGTAAVEWNVADFRVSEGPSINPMPGAGPVAASSGLFTAADFTMQLSNIAALAASEVARLKTEAEIDAGFSSDARALLDDVASALKESAAKGYRSVEADIISGYGDYARDAGAMKDKIGLGESMEYVLGRDMVGYYQLNSVELNEMKQSQWADELEKLRGEFAAERCRFRFAKEGKLLAAAMTVSADQSAMLENLGKELEKLADYYALRVAEAITQSAESAGIYMAPPEISSAGLADSMRDFKKEFERRFDKANLITGG